MIRDLIIRIINHLSVEVHPDAEWFIILMINSRIISIVLFCNV